MISFKINIYLALDLMQSQRQNVAKALMWHLINAEKHLQFEAIFNRKGCDKTKMSIKHLHRHHWDSVPKDINDYNFACKSCEFVCNYMIENNLKLPERPRSNQSEPKIQYRQADSNRTKRFAIALQEDGTKAPIVCRTHIYKCKSNQELIKIGNNYQLICPVCQIAYNHLYTGPFQPPLKYHDEISKLITKQFPQTTYRW